MGEDETTDRLIRRLDVVSDDDLIPALQTVAAHDLRQFILASRVAKPQREWSPDADRSRWPVGWRLATAGTGLVVMLLVLVAANLWLVRHPESTPEAPLSIGGGALDARCVETFSPSNLAQRGFAFDGTVTQVSKSPPDSDLYVDVTFSIHEWYRPDGPSELTIEMVRADAAASVEGASYEVGSRLLVSGESRWGESGLRDLIAWGCGFSQIYSTEQATVWRSAFADAGE